MVTLSVDFPTDLHDIVSFSLTQSYERIRVDQKAYSDDNDRVGYNRDSSTIMYRGKKRTLHEHIVNIPAANSIDTEGLSLSGNYTRRKYI